MRGFRRKKKDEKIIIKNQHEINLIRESCKIVSDVLKLVGSFIQPGVTTKKLDSIAEDFIRSCGGIPAFKGYGFEKKNLFPATLCVSIDDEVVHGIPSERELQEGQIVSVDVGVKKNGYYGDGAHTFSIGKISEEKSLLLEITKQSLTKGIEQAIEGNTVGDISFAIQQYVESVGFSVVRDLVGHGVGKDLHEEPSVPNYGEQGEGAILKEGMVLAIEPMVNAGTYKVFTADDGWTIYTDDEKPSAHFEHTVVVRKSQAEILTEEI